MLELSTEQVISLVHLIATSQPDDLDCDGCFALIAEFADYEAGNEPLSTSMKRVERHLTQCGCCKYEYEALVEAIAANESSLNHPQVD